MASFSGGAVGVISALMLIEANNVEQQEKKRCKYCHGTGECWYCNLLKTSLLLLLMFTSSDMIFCIQFILGVLCN